MKKTCCFLLSALLMFSSAAMAESIAGKFGGTVKGGFKIAADSKTEPDVGTKIETDTGYAVGGGFIYGINDFLAADLDILYSENDMNFLSVKIAKAKVVDISLGLQYRFIPKEKLVPYVGAGISVIVPDIELDSTLAGFAGIATSTDTDAAFGGFAKVGLDFFVTPKIALNAEFKGTLATEQDVKQNGVAGIKYDPSNFSGLFGVRFFFN